MEPWYDQAYGCKARDAVERNLHRTVAQKETAEKQYHSVTDRKKSEYMKKRNAELCAMSAKDPNHFWRAFKAPSHSSCPVELTAQFEALMGAQPAQGIGSSPPSGVSDSCTPDAACLNADITPAELRDCIKRN